MRPRCIIDIETEDLDPKSGRIICIGVLDTATNKSWVFYDENEKQMLRDFLDFFHNRGFKEVIGYNVLFDLRYIFARCLKYNLASNSLFKIMHSDLMHIMKSVKNVYSLNKAGTLNQWAEFLFGSGKYPLPDSIPKLFESGNISLIIEYNKRDLEITYQLWKRIQRVFSNGVGMQIL